MVYWSIPSKAEAVVIQVRYQTADGSVGPFPIRFDPDVALYRDVLVGVPATSVKQCLVYLASKADRAVKRLQRFCRKSLLRQAC